MLKRYDEPFSIEQNVSVYEAIASYMNDEIREAVHADLAPCTREEFLFEYLRRDPDFQDLMRVEFDITLEV